MTNSRYATPAAFKQALEQRLRNNSASGVDLARRRQLVVFERLLARVHIAADDTAILKGGLVLELRLQRARTTKDVDLRMMGSQGELLDRLQAAGRLDLGDFMHFEIQRDRHHPEIRSEGMRHAGYRFAAECRLAGKIYGRPFGIDVAFGDPLTGTPDEILGDRLLDFAGIEPARLRVYPVATHVAEKLHAYTMPRVRPNTRIKDLPDLALLASAGEADAAELLTAIQATFEFRSTHPLPDCVPTPPNAWNMPYQEMARADELPWKTLESIHGAAAVFLDPILSGRTRTGRWMPTEWRWRGA